MDPSSTIQAPEYKKYAQVYKAIAETPAVTSAYFPGSCFSQRQGKETFNPSSVIIQTSQRDILNKKKVSALSQFHSVPNPEGNGVLWTKIGFPTEINDSSSITLSPSRKFMACVKSLDASDKTKTAIQVWSADKLLHSIPTSIAPKHGPVYTDTLMGGLSWSPDEQYIAYIAEKKNPENETYFMPETEANAKSTRGKEFEYVSDWGEQYSGKKRAEIFVVDLKNTSIKKIEIPENITPGQIIWTPSNDALIYAGWEIPEGIKFGFIYCFNRPSKLYITSINGGAKTECLAERETRARSPKLSRDGKTLFFLSTREVITHNTCSRLLKMDMESKKVTVVVDCVDKPVNDEFPGIYMDVFPPSVNAYAQMSDDLQFLFIESFWRSNLTILKINTSNGEVSPLIPGVDRRCSSITLLDVCKDHVLYGVSSPVTPTAVYIFDVKNSTSTLVYGIPPPTQIQSFGFKVHDVTPKDSNQKHDVYEAIVIHDGHPKGSAFATYPHGGPHSNSAATWNPNYCFLAAIGYTVILVNYRGSTGFGIASLESLLGKVGTQDVNDVQHAVEEMVKLYELDTKNAFVIGGSHGGFLATHMIGQFPEYYNAAVAHNPVTDFPAAVRTSDIPDWVFAESLACAPKPFPSSEDLTVMFDKSPISHVGKVKTPLLLKIGQLDARVHPTQGLSYYRALINNGSKAVVYMYPTDCHPIDSVNSESDSYVNIALWFQSYRK